MNPWQKWTLAGGAVLVGVVLLVLALGVSVEVGTVKQTTDGDRTTTHVVKVNSHIPLP
jgi:hypothetical protein